MWGFSEITFSYRAASRACEYVLYFDYILSSASHMCICIKTGPTALSTKYSFSSVTFLLHFFRCKLYSDIQSAHLSKSLLSDQLRKTFLSPHPLLTLCKRSLLFFLSTVYLFPPAAFHTTPGGASILINFCFDMTISLGASMQLMIDSLKVFRLHDEFMMKQVVLSGGKIVAQKYLLQLPASSFRICWYNSAFVSLL